jgi:RES domain-containing protein
MIVYRLGKTKFANDLVSEGSRLYGSRWNQKGIACLYTAESRALALLEYSVNVNIHDIPRALSITTIDLDKASIQTLTESDLPGDWKTFPAPASTQSFGSLLLKTAATAIIKIPSTVIPHEFNYILNPIHSDHGLCRILDIEDFIYDLRIKIT